jgi:drug/metabolite transporter superfamily protein YnfA
MSLTSVPLLSPPWLDELAPNAILISSVLNRSLRGRDAIIKVVQAVGGMYEAHSVVFRATFADRELLEYDALAFGVAVHGVVILSRNTEGEIFNVGVHHGPVEAVNKLSAALKERLSVGLGALHRRR